MTPRPLNLGCGPKPPDGWANVDVVDYGQGERGWVGDFTEGLPWGDNEFGFAVAHHSLQQVPYVKFLDVLVEVRRVLVPGGLLRISVPDLRGAIDAWLRADADWFPVVDSAELSLGGKLAAYVTWYSEARMVFTRGWLAEWAVRAGYAQSAVCVAGLTILGDPTSTICALDSRPDESIYLEALK